MHVRNMSIYVLTCNVYAQRWFYASAVQELLYLPECTYVLYCHINVDFCAHLLLETAQIFTGCLFPFAYHIAHVFD